MNQQRHIIGKVSLELSSTLADTWGLQETASQIVQQRLTPAMAELFERLTPPQQIARFGQVVVDIGPIAPEDLESELSRRVIAALEQVLTERLTTLSLRQQLDAAPAAALRAPETGAPETGAPETAVEAPETASLKALLHFLEWGRLPWWSAAAAWSAQLSQWETLISGAAPLQLAPLQALLLRSPRAWQRFVHQLSAACRRAYLLATSPDWRRWPTQLPEIRQLQRLLDTSPDADFDLSPEAWLALLGPGEAPAAAPDREALLHWLQTGRLPGWAAHLGLEGWIARWTESLPDDRAWQRPVGQLLRQSQAARLRFTQLPPGYRLQLLLLLEPGWLDWPQRLREGQLILQDLRLAAGAQQDLETQGWLLVLGQLSSAPARATPLPATRWMQGWLKRVAETLNVQAVEDPAQPAGDAIANRIRSAISQIAPPSQPPWLEALDALPTDISQNSPAPRQDDPQTGSPGSAGPELAQLADIASSPCSTDDADLTTEETDMGLYIPQAGLVLLHPFLTTYFDAVGLTQGETFLDPTMQQRAVYLLHYLATGETTAPEPALVLPKLLCGWPLSAPLTAGLPLPPDALTEAEHLLNTVIGYWQALKNTTPNGLREGFLQREGKLLPRDSGWKLWVEQQTIDILLGRLPWGLSMITLPWMDGILTVEWA